MSIKNKRILNKNVAKIKKSPTSGSKVMFPKINKQINN